MNTTRITRVVGNVLWEARCVVGALWWAARNLPIEAAERVVRWVVRPHVEQVRRFRELTYSISDPADRPGGGAKVSASVRPARRDWRAVRLAGVVKDWAGEYVDHEGRAITPGEWYWALVVPDNDEPCYIRRMMLIGGEEFIHVQAQVNPTLALKSLSGKRWYARREDAVLAALALSGGKCSHYRKLAITWENANRAFAREAKRGTQRSRRKVA